MTKFKKYLLELLNKYFFGIFYEAKSSIDKKNYSS